MKFKVLKKTASGSLLLSALDEQAKENAPKLEGKALSYQGKKAAVVYDVIASAHKPLLLAKPTADVPVEGILEKR